ncbi:hypothetical protein D8B26_006655 [Coccidioides posadasii str. Silveira]|uniref:Uncharacterized protein n=3 Tax=Coccidioides posadasii TaxID=199306 RepID=E9CUK8_COCPS|nr:hypothetical protein CPC735_026320 [Coccidioides posadasii C735 delta SOWgp]EER27296.1 hypothetical protein CPC735_026320 [Coccidioides posadasii C735 delta SOWgp]EFW23136.1 hypothetical protein CPSG_01035 [Coccidioides posadasii str. Silveira]KMM67071.1 DUF500 and UBA/TS-N domain-containing protein [Coccidioides posadasii RMSCC 3488]QVM12019.1 hypothetical protein D8B26_006655 [Coccidioides posadasii str. Silveira]|eukprot:XP_003069441.1 hypothetical protein CPC735_026320 [Coccidioides posadasii C735 delta SOWgp]
MAPPTQRKWEKAKVYSKRGFDKAWHTLDKLGRPINRLSNKLGAEAFWPTTLDLESEKAARILRSFCKDGFYAEIDSGNGTKPTEGIPRGKQRVVKRIPASVIKQAKGLAIFTTMRTGLWVSGSGGSGVLLGRIKETGEWSPPSGIMTHTAGLGFLAGVDIYDCVVVINTYEALEAFKAVRCTLGGEVAASAGPIGAGGNLETEVHKRQAPVWTYIKGRGFYAGVQIEGTIVIERCDENERFYGERISVSDILAGKTKRPPSSIKTLMQTLKAAQGDGDVKEDMLPSGDTPGDIDLTGTFGIPDADDPDPYGVKALEREGILIREAGTRQIPKLDAFDYRPISLSPKSARFSASGSRRSSVRNSLGSFGSADRGTQTDDSYFEQSGYSPTSTSPPRSVTSYTFPRAVKAAEAEELDYESTHFKHEDVKHVPVRRVNLSDHNVPIVSASAPASFAKARLVTIPKRVPPILPPRNPERVVSPVSSRSEIDDSATLSSISPVDEETSIADIQNRLRRLRSGESQSPAEDDRGRSTERDDFHSAPASPSRTEELVQDSTLEKAH